LQFVGRTRFGGLSTDVCPIPRIREFSIGESRLRNGADIAEKYFPFADKYFPFADKIRRKHFNQDLINGRDL
jgi:hypothetical protein